MTRPSIANVRPSSRRKAKPDAGLGLGSATGNGSTIGGATDVGGSGSASGGGRAVTIGVAGTGSSMIGGRLRSSLRHRTTGIVIADGRAIDVSGQRYQRPPGGV